MDITKIEEFLREYGSRLRLIFWLATLFGVLLFWPIEVSEGVEPEVIIKTQIVYVYKESDLPEELKPEVVEEVEEIIEEPEYIPVLVAPRYGFTDNDIYLMTVLLCGSAKTDGDGEYDIDFYNKDNHEQISLVLSVVMNRVMSSRFPNTVTEVIWQKGQFSPMPRWKAGLPTVSDSSYAIVQTWCEAYDNYDSSVMYIPESHLFFSGNGVINKSRER